MSTCRSMTGQAVRKVKQVQASVAAMINNQITGIKVSGHHLRPQQNGQVNSYNQHSRAEDTIKREQDRKRKASACPVGFVQKFVTSNGVDYPCHPADEAQHSPYPVGFRGCYGCGGQHGFMECPTKREQACYQKFHWNLHCHKPEIYFKNRTGKQPDRGEQAQKNVTFGHYGPESNTRQSNTYGSVGQGQRTRPPVGRGRGTNTPSWMNSVTPMSTSSSSIPPPPRLPPRPNDREGENYEDQANIFVEEYLQFLDINSMIKINHRPMPITSRNELPHIKLTISCCNGDNAICIKMIYDTGAALSTGFLDYHENIWKNHPKVVARYEKFDGENPFDPIKLCGAINNPKDYDESKHGLLSAVIEYYTPYKYSDGSAFTLTLALGVGMAVNSILGLPTIIEGEIEPK